MPSPFRPWLLCFLVIFVIAPATAEDGFFDSNGVKIHYSIQGQGDPVLLIHGFTANIPMQWGGPGVIRELEKSYQVIGIDNRGHGRSDKPHDPEKYGIEMVEDQVRLLDHLKIERAHVVGYSMGGFITDKLLTTHPERVVTATLGGAGWSRPGDARLSFLPQLAESLENGRGIGPLLEHLTPAGQPKPTEDQLRVVNGLISTMNDSKALAAVIRGMNGLMIPEEKLRENQVPTLALIGAIDPMKDGVDELEKVMANLKVVVIADADHMNTPAKPEFINSLKDFLAEHPASTTKFKEPVTAAAAGK